MKLIYQVDDKPTSPCDNVVRVAIWAHGNVAQRRVRAQRARPGDGDDVVFIERFSAGNHHHGGGIQHVAGAQGAFFRGFHIV